VNPIETTKKPSGQNPNCSLCTANRVFLRVSGDFIVFLYLTAIFLSLHFRDAAHKKAGLIREKQTGLSLTGRAFNVR
jgi:hypothetical protein